MILFQLAKGMLVSIEIFALTLLFSLPLGLVVAFGRMAKNVVLRSVTKAYISIMRGTPLMLQLLIIYFGPSILFKVKIGPGYRFVAVILAFSINYAAYFAEIYRAGIESIPVGQYEAATVLGYNKVQTFLRIVFPQMCKRIMPPVTNETITLVKDTSFAFVISYPEMFTIAKQISAAQTTIMPLIIAGVFYFIFNGIVAFVMDKIEKKMNYYR